MRDPQNDEIDRILSDWMYETPPPQWQLDMMEHYERTGTYRPEDIQRLCGDISEGVSIGPDDSLEDILNAALQRQSNGTHGMAD
jgi:hypothetical protein